jgi:prepilin-type N-terminal cleavage/methylation domain-containing protein
MNERNKPARSRAGFTLIEILVAVAILAILSAALTPMVIKYVNDGRRARALSDSEAIAQAITAFNLDTGAWPVNNDDTVNNAGELSRLVGLPHGFADGDIPDGAGVADGDDSWNGGGDGGEAGAMEDHLIFNQTGAVDPLYPASTTPPQPPGWNGPYLDSIPVDPWNRPYVCNVRYLQDANVAGTNQAERDRHAVLCLSAGQNGQFETSFSDGTELEGPGGDDLGAMIQGSRFR